MEFNTVGSGLVSGAAVMALFGAGTSVALILLGLISTRISLKLRQRMNTVAAVVVILTGVYFTLKAVYMWWKM